MAQANPFEEWIDRYFANARGFVVEVIGAEPDEKQTEALDAVSRGERRIAIRSGHGVGKTTLDAWIIVWWICTRYPQKTVCTAPTAAQLFEALATETRSWLTKLPPALQNLFEVKTDHIFLKAAPDDSFVSFRTSRPEVPEAMAGIHSAFVLLIADEASGVAEQVFEAGAGSMSGFNAVTILSGNPVRTSGLFFDAFHKLADKWVGIHISCLDCPRVTPDFVEDMARRYGRDSNAFRVRVLGEFPATDTDTVIPWDLVEASRQRDVKATFTRPIWGLDPARFGNNKSALAKRKANVLLEPVKMWDGLELMELAGRIKVEWDDTLPSERPEEILVDSVGIGAGVLDRLRELGLPARGINVGESPALKDRFANLKAELWWACREWFQGRDVVFDDALTAEQLTVVRYKFSPTGKLTIERKEDLQKRGFPSPDRADAFILTFAGNAVSASAGSSKSPSWNTALKRNIGGVTGIDARRR